MASYTSYVIYEKPDLYQQALSGSFGIDIPNFAAYGLWDIPSPIPATSTHVNTQFISHDDGASYVIPTYADDLFNHWLVVPSVMTLGNVLSNETRTLEYANLYFTTQAVASLTPNAGPGLVLTGVPSFPHNVLPLGSMTVLVSISIDGPPTISGTIDATFGGGAPDIHTPVSGTRVTMFPWPPELPVDETLEWATDIMTSQSDDEQRHGLLLAPRQRLKFTVQQDDPVQWQRLHNLLFDWLPRVFGVPMWWEQRSLDAAVVAGASVLPVDTSNGDFIAGGLVMIIDTETYLYEAFQIDHLDASHIYLTSILVNNWPANSTVMPVHTAYANTSPSGSRWPVASEQTHIEFVTLDNNDLADVGSAHTFNGKVLLDDPNAMTNQLSESWSRAVTVIDNKSGRVFQSTLTDRSRRRTKKGWQSNNIADLWRIRKLVHSFRGSQKSFYMPSFRADFKITDDIAGSAATFRCVNVGYTQFVQSRAPANYVRLKLADGTTIIRQITGSAEDVGNREVITIASPFSGSTIPVANIKCADIVWLVRISDDKVTIKHEDAGVASIECNVVSVKA